MLNRRTVFIVGAGASAECGLPTGAKLKDLIRVGTDFRFGQSGSDDLLEILRHRYPNADIKKYVTGGQKLSSSIGTFPSIDEALHWWSSHQEIVELGTLAIAHYILDAESRSSLAAKGGAVNLKDSERTWLATFMSMALSGLKQDAVSHAFENTTIINFNYDRTVEHYLYWALQQLGISTTEAAESVARLKIIRPYGSIGQLEWQGRSGLSFGGNNNPIVASEIANNIRTFTEQIQEETVHSSIEEALRTQL
jgi:hypothetical protein